MPRHRLFVAGLLGLGALAALFLTVYSGVILHSTPAESAVWGPTIQVPAKTKEEMTPLAKKDDNEVHLVFTTDCSGYQHWQSIALWYAAQSAGQSGPITRVATGCSDDERRQIAAEWRAIDRTGRFRVHFAPHFELHPRSGGKYPYSNKPGGLRHWLANAEPPITQEYVALIDPDMLLLRPITPALSEGLEPGSRDGKSGLQELVDFDGIGRLLYTTRREVPVSRVAKGSAAGQHFGIGGSIHFNCATYAFHNIHDENAASYVVWWQESGRVQ